MPASQAASIAAVASELGVTRYRLPITEAPKPSSVTATGVFWICRRRK
jgi:hypothetical protein